MSSDREREREREVRWNIFTWRNWLDNQYVPNNSNINNNNRSSSSTKESRNRSGVCKWTRVPLSPSVHFWCCRQFIFTRPNQRKKNETKRKEREKENCNLFTRCGLLRELAFEPRTAPRSIASLRLVCVTAKCGGQSTSNE